MKKILTTACVFVALMAIALVADELRYENHVQDFYVTTSIAASTDATDTTVALVVNLQDSRTNHFCVGVSVDPGTDSTTYTVLQWSVDSTTWTSLAEIDSTLSGAAHTSASGIYSSDSIGARYVRVLVIVAENSGSATGDTATVKGVVSGASWFGY